jgi:uncharacterized protein involved in outer membrane biogenesis
MKKFIKIIIGIFLLLILLLILVPIFFKGQITDLVKNEINKRIDATLNFSDVGLNLFEHFPNFTLSVDNPTIVNKKPFEGDTLLSASSLKTTIDLFSVIGGKQIKIKDVSLNDPKIFIYVLKDSSANYNIYQSDTSKAKFNIALDRYSINNADIAYINQLSDMSVLIKGLNHNGSGNLSQDKFDLNTNTKIQGITFIKGGITYLNKAAINLTLNLNVNTVDKSIILLNNELMINDLPLKLSGKVAAANNKLNLDLSFSSPNGDFKSLLSLIPAIYQKDFQNLKASGRFNFNGDVKGIYDKNNFPAFNFNLGVNNGNFQYPKLPSSINDVQLSLNITNPGKKLDNMVIDLKELSFNVQNNPISASLFIKNPTTNTYLDGKINGSLDLSNLKNAVKMENVSELSGKVTSNVSFQGNLGEQKTDYKNLNLTGSLQLNNINYKGTNQPNAVKISDASVSLNKERLSLNDLNLKIGESDLHANGYFTDFLNYVLNDGNISGNLNLTSNYLNLNQLMEGQKSTDTTKMAAVDIPGNIDFVTAINFKKLIYENLNLNNAAGSLIIKNKKLTLQNLRSGLLGGNFVINGDYNSTKTKSPAISFNIKLNDFNVKQTYQSFVTVKQFVPMAQYVDGSFSSSLNLTSSLDYEMMPVWNSFNSSGSLDIKKAEIKGFKPFEEIGSKLNISELENPNIMNKNVSFKITNGRFYVSPFDFKIGNYTMTIAGSNGLDKSLSYNVGVDIPAGKLKSEVNSAVSSLLKKDTKVISSENVKINTTVGGTIDNPKLAFSGGSTASQVEKNFESQVKQQVNQKVEEQKQQLQKKVETKVDTVKNQLKKQAENKLKDLFKKFK